MVRVLMADGSARDVDANSIACMASGDLQLSRVDVRFVSDPANLGKPPRQEVSNPQLVSLLAQGTWHEVINLDLEPASEAVLEVATNGEVLN